jgi:hypothetical protein
MTRDEDRVTRGHLSTRELDDLERRERRNGPAPDILACPECGGVMIPHRNGPICTCCGYLPELDSR